jgi:hypothetical protein
MNSKKVWRALVANLLVVLLVTTSNGGSFITKRAAPAAQEVEDETKITKEETEEAHEVAGRFLRRLQETNDLTPLVGEMFVPDYAARLSQEATNKPLTLLSKSAVAQASREELARYDLALNNSLYLASLLLLAYQTAHPAEDDVDEWGAAYYKRTLPPEIIELCKNDPILRVLFEEETNERGEENQSGASPSENSDVIDHDDEPIRSREQLRSFTSTLEQIIVLARKHLAASPLKLTLVDRHKGASEEENWEAESKLWKPRAWTLTRESYGYPIGTRILCVNVAVYHMDLIRVDGRLKVLALYLDMD